MNKFIFISFASMITKKNLGVCVIESTLEDAEIRAIELGLQPDEPVHARAYELDQAGFDAQGLELDKFYTIEEMQKKGFEKGKVSI